MRTVTMVWCLMMAACSAKTFDRSTLLASTALLAVDWSQTRGQAERGWVGTSEANPMLGAHPDARGVDAYFGISAVANVLLWAALPPRWRSVVPVGLSALELRTVARNMPSTGMFGR